jgi:DNA-binding XRE family transcriptional regulator
MVGTPGVSVDFLLFVSYSNNTSVDAVSQHRTMYFLGIIFEVTEMAFGSRLKELREAAKLTQGQLAAAAGMSTGSVANLEQGFRKEATYETRRKLAAALGVDVPAFDSPADDRPPSGRGRPRKPATAKKPGPKKRVGRPRKK